MDFPTPTKSSGYDDSLQSTNIFKKWKSEKPTEDTVKVECRD